MVMNAMNAYETFKCGISEEPKVNYNFMRIHCDEFQKLYFSYLKPKKEEAVSKFPEKNILVAPATKDK
jgi:hypothetical protein